MVLRLRWVWIGDAWHMGSQIANKGLKAMLNDDSKAIANFKEELDLIGEFLAKDGNKQALTFCYTLLMMCDHVLCKESLKLQVRTSTIGVAAST